MRNGLLVLILFLSVLRVQGQTDTALPGPSNYSVEFRKGRWQYTTLYYWDSITVCKIEKKRNGIGKGVIRWHKDYNEKGELQNKYRERRKSIPDGYRLVKWQFRKNGNRCIKRHRYSVVRFI